MRKALYASLALNILLAACVRDVAGGVSEETNTLAGILRDSDGNLAAGTVVMARHLDRDDVKFVDTTDSEGRFGMPLRLVGAYGISAKNDSTAYYSVVQYTNGDTLEIKGELVNTVDVRGVMQKSDGSAAIGFTVSLPGSSWEDWTDSEGHFLLRDVPEGMFAIESKSSDAKLFDDAFYVLKTDENGYSFEGPLPQSVAERVVEDGVLEDVSLPGSKKDSTSTGNKMGTDTTIVVNTPISLADSGHILYQPISLKYGALGVWPLDLISEKNGLMRTEASLGSIGDIVFYGEASLSEGISNKAIVLNGARDYGVIEDDRGAMDSLSAFTLEVWVNVDTIEGDESYRKNVIGKLGFGETEDKDVFSLAIVQGECGAVEPTFAIFLADGSGDSLSCQNAVVADTAVMMDEWIYVVSVWDGTQLKLYLNGQLAAVKDVSIRQLDASSEPMLFGKETISMKLDEIKMLSTALESADVFYRYKYKGGAL